MFRTIGQLTRRHVWNATPFAILVLGLIGVLLFPTIPTAAGSAPPATEWPTDVKLLAATWYYVLDAIHAPGANATEWRSNLEVCNFSAGYNNFELQYLAYDQGNLNPVSYAFGLGASLCRRYNDVLLNPFSLQNNKGTVRLETEGTGMRAVARTFNNASTGTFGQFSEGLFATDGVGPGQAGSVIHLTQSASNTTGFRSNLSLQSTCLGNMRVNIDLYTAAGAYLGRVNRDLLAYEYDQVTYIFRQLTQAEVVDGYAVLSTPSSQCWFLAAGSMVDNRTGDGTTIPMKRIVQ